MDNTITTTDRHLATRTATIAVPSRSCAASDAALELVVAGVAGVTVAAVLTALTAPGFTVAAFAAAAFAMAAFCAMTATDVQGNAYGNGRGIAPISFRPFSSGSWHFTTTTKEKKGHSQRERCT